MSDAGGAQKRPALRGGPSLARGGVAPRSQSPALLPRRALPRSQIWASQLSRLFRDGPLAHLAQYKKVSSPRRVRARIPSPVWVLRHLSGKARGLRILSVWKGRATPPGGMDRRPNRGRYSCANPKVTTTFCIAPCTPISYTSFLCPTAVSRLNGSQSKKPQHSWAMRRFFLSRSVQIRPKSGRDFAKVILSQALK